MLGGGHARSFSRLTKEANSGVTLQRMREVYAEDVPDPWYRELLPFFQRLSKHEMRGGLIGGYLMDVPMVAPPIYLERLHAQFLAAGGGLEQRKVESLDMNSRTRRPCWSIAAASALVKWLTTIRSIPCAGRPSSPMRRESASVTWTTGSVDHIFPRADGVLIGGVKVKGDWNRQLDPAISADILQPRRQG